MYIKESKDTQQLAPKLSVEISSKNRFSPSYDEGSPSLTMLTALIITLQKQGAYFH